MLKKIDSFMPLNPKARAAAVFALGFAVTFGLFSLVGGALLNNAFFGAWVGLAIVYVLYRNGYFAQSVTLLLYGADEPVRQRLRNMSSRRRLQADAAPDYLHADEIGDADNDVQPEDRVIAFELDGHAIAYPLAAMGVREVAHEVFDDTHVFVTWWPITYSARVFIVEPGRGEEPELKSVSKMLLNSMVLADESETEIVQFVGQGVTGPRAGQTLRQIPVVSTNWRAWSLAHPETEVLSLDGTPDTDIFERYYVNDRPGLHRQPARDRRIHDKDNVLGVEINGEVRCYPYPELIQQPLVNDVLGGEPVLIAHERLSATVLPFIRFVDGRTLTFVGDSKNPVRPQPTAAEPDVRRRINYEPWFLRDEQTGSLWRALTGECVEGELQGQQMQMLPGQSGFWFAYSHFYPGADVFESRNRGGPTDR